MVLTDYKEALIEFRGNMRAKPVKSFIYGGLLTSGIFFSYNNPDERNFKINFMDNANDLVMVSDKVRNGGCESLQNYLARGFNADLLRRTNFGVCSVMWVDDYSSELGSAASQCEYLKPGWLDMRYRIVDVGFMNRWWISHNKMVDFDVNSEEWKDEETSNVDDEENIVEKMWLKLNVLKHSMFGNYSSYDGPYR